MLNVFVTFFSLSLWKPQSSSRRCRPCPRFWAAGPNHVLHHPSAFSSQQWRGFRQSSGTCFTWIINNNKNFQLLKRNCLETLVWRFLIRRSVFMLCVLLLVASGQVLQFKLSDIGEGIVEVTVKEWCVSRWSVHVVEELSQLLSQSPHHFTSLGLFTYGWTIFHDSSYPWWLLLLSLHITRFLWKY